MNADIELKPCPFCGRTNNIYSFKDGGGNTLWSINCGTHNCPARSSFASGSEDEVRFAWNRRAAIRALKFTAVHKDPKSDWKD